MSISKAKYEKLITKFIDRWGTIISKPMIEDIQGIWKWVSDYSTEMSKRSSVHDQIRYIKRGANLLKRFSDRYREEDAELQGMLMKCRMQLLQNTGCSPKTKRELTELIEEYSLFAEELIGCQSTGADYILGLLRRPAIKRALGKEYERTYDSIERVCLEIRMDRLKR